MCFMEACCVCCMEACGVRVDAVCVLYGGMLCVCFMEACCMLNVHCSNH